MRWLPSKLNTSRRIILVILMVVILGGAHYLTNRFFQKQKLYTVARLLNFESASQIAQIYNCWDIFAHCGQSLFYKTDLSQDRFKTLLETLAWEQGYETEVDTQVIFTDINYDTAASLTVNGVEPSGPSRETLSLSLGRRWRLLDPWGRSWTISYYPLATAPGDYALNGRPFKQNIVSVLYHTYP